METNFNINNEKVREVINNLKVLLTTAGSKDAQKLREHIESITRIYANYKVVRHETLGGWMLVRVADDAILYCNENKDYVSGYAAGFCHAKDALYYVED